MIYALLALVPLIAAAAVVGSYLHGMWKLAAKSAAEWEKYAETSRQSIARLRAAELSKPTAHQLLEVFVQHDQARVDLGERAAEKWRKRIPKRLRARYLGRQP